MLYITVQKERVSDVKKALSKLGLLPNGVRTIQLLNGDYAIPVLVPEQLDDFSAEQTIELDGKGYVLKRNIDLPPHRARKPYDIMKRSVQEIMRDMNLWSDHLTAEIPSSWVKYGDLVVFSPLFFEDPAWKKAGEGLWKAVCQSLRVQRIGRLYKVIPDSYRTPKLEIIFGGSQWVQITDNHIKYTWDARHCMFSPGNATERARVSRMDCRNETVIDMYAGIGYFTLPFLVHAKAKYVYACEWNPSALAALRQNLIENKVTDRCQIHRGDCRLEAPKCVADRVYLGLIPSCESGMFVACMALKLYTGGVLHIHANVSSYKKKENIQDLPKYSAGELLSSSHSMVNGHSNSVNTPSIVESNSNADHLCLKCHLIDKIFPPDLMSCIEYSMSKSDIQHSTCSSFALRGIRGCPTWFPEAEVTWKKKEWLVHGYHLSHIVFDNLFRFHQRPWRVAVINVHHVKSYAPHVDHLVYDLHCTPEL